MSCPGKMGFAMFITKFFALTGCRQKNVVESLRKLFCSIQLYGMGWLVG